MKTEFKNNENSELHIRIKFREFTDELGRKIVETKWVKANGEINLGSMAKPNKEVLEFKYNIPEDKPLFEKLFGD